MTHEICQKLPISPEDLYKIAYQLRLDCLRSTTAAGSGHVTSCLSAADIVSVLFFHTICLDPDDYNNPCNDRFILSKGHAAPLLYAIWHQLGKVSVEEMLSLRQFDSLFEGHPTPRFPYAEAATGSLGQGLSIGLGMAFVAKSDALPYYVYVLLGDSECAEGSVWEAVEIAAYYKTDNLIAIVDVNRLGQSTQTMEGHDLERFQKKFEAFGWKVFLCNGHDVVDIMNSFHNAQQVRGQPSVILCKTYKGYGLDADVEDKNGFHGKAISQEKLSFFEEKLQERLKDRLATLSPDIKLPAEFRFRRMDCKKSSICCRFGGSSQDVMAKGVSKNQGASLVPDLPTYSFDEKVATRKGYGTALVSMGKIYHNLVSLDAEVKNSTYAEIFEEKFPDRFYQCFIAEQNMIGMAVGMVARGKIPFVSTFAAFLTRACDQIRMAAIGQAPLRICGSHAGVSIGEDGPSQMGLEDIALMRTLPESIILYPCDAVSTHKCVELMVNYTKGISYLRTTRSPTPIIYKPIEKFIIGGCKQLHWDVKDQVCVLAAGITVFEALKAYEILKKDGVFIRVIDCYSIKPLPVDDIIQAAKLSQNRIVTVEDHYMQGGLGEAVCAAVINYNIQVTCLAVTKLPRSGKPEELMAYEEIDAAAIVKSVKALIATMH
jgi:transketolase